MSGEAVGFPAFPPTGRGSGRFARTWWGQAWLRAVEDSALDAEPLRRGRRLARAGRLGPIAVSPGRLAAQVFDGPSAHHAVVLVDTLGDEQWRRFLDEVTAKAGHLAALLARDMPAELVEAAGQADVPLLPGVGELRAECECPDWELCQHAAALCAQAAWLLDADPFVLLLLRGRAERELTAELRRRKCRNPGKSTPVAAVANGAVLSLPELPPLTGPPAPLDVPPAPGIDPAQLARLAARAAARAAKLLLGDGSGAESEIMDVVAEPPTGRDRHRS